MFILCIKDYFVFIYLGQFLVLRLIILFDVVKYSDSKQLPLIVCLSVYKVSDNLGCWSQVRGFKLLILVSLNIDLSYSSTIVKVF